MKVLEHVGLEDLSDCAEQILNEGKSIFAFTGDLGAGKTTLIQHICAQLGVQDEVVSPTFGIVNEYADKDSNPIYHFDLYRIKDIEEMLDMGFTSYLDSGNLCLIEWPEVAQPVLEEYDLSLIKIIAEENDSRRIFVVST